MTMKKGPSPAIVTTSLLGSAALFGTSSGLFTSAAAIPTMLASLAGGLASAIAVPVGVTSIPVATLASPFFTTFLDLFSGLSRGFWDASLGNDLFSEVFGTIACHSGACGGTAAAAATAVTAAPCPFC